MSKKVLCLSLSELEAGICSLKKEKIGILGGSFNPVHNGHLLLAETARKEIGLSRILFLPTGRPYHKDRTALLPFFIRVKMLELALEESLPSSPYFYSTMEGERGGDSYTYDSLLLLRKAFPEASFYFILGTDEYFTLASWHEIYALGKLCTFLVANRNDSVAQSVLKEWERKWKAMYGLCSLFLSMKGVDFSSSTIRKRLERGESIHAMVPEAVESYIREKHLYQ